MLGISSVDAKNGDNADDIGSGLQTDPNKSPLRNTEYGQGGAFSLKRPANLQILTVKEDPLDPDSPNKVVRQWSRPQI